MAGLIGWWTSEGAQRLDIDVWLRRFDKAADLNPSALRGEAGCIALGGPGNSLRWKGDALEVVLLGRSRWNGISTTETSLPEIGRAFREKDRAFLDLLRGQFLICVIDHSTREGIVAIDRSGSFPLAYSIAGAVAVFATDARDVAAHPAVGSSISNQAIFNYLYAHMVPSPHTVFENVSKLEPGHYLRFGSAGCSVNRYWQMPYSANSRMRFNEAAEDFRRLLRQGVARSMDGEPQGGSLGTFLSGGTDSSTVSGLVSELGGRPAEAYSIGFDAQDFDETDYARLAAKHFGCNLHEYYVTPEDVCNAIPRVAGAYDEPFGNASAVPAFLCAQRARQDGRSVLLAGDGGDEIFGGNARYAKQKVFETYWGIPQSLRSGVIEPIILRSPFFTRGPLTKVRSYITQARVPLPDRLETYNFLEREALSRVFDDDFLSAVRPTHPAEIARRSYEEAPAGQPVNRMMHLDLKQTLADNDLRKVVRTGAMAGMEVRFPLLDDDLLEFAASLPEHWKVRGLKLRWFFKEALKDFLPAEIITKKKHGFGLPFGVWMATDSRLQSLAYDSLSQLKQRKVIRAEYLEQLIAQHRSGHASYYGVMIWVLMMLEQWFQAHAPR